jgi:hypothetical protein
MITRNVVLAGLLLAAAIGGALGLIWVSSLVPS